MLYKLLSANFSLSEEKLYYVSSKEENEEELGL
jgi:hypothetical protein